MQAAFSIRRLRFQFRALDAISFGAPGAANALRGALGFALRPHTENYRRIFRPVRPVRPVQGQPGPSGLVDPPRSFVIRAAHLDGRSLEPGELFSFDLHLFETGAAETLESAFADIARQGIGATRGRAEMIHPPAVEDIAIDLAAKPPDLSRLRIDFLTPVELKSEGEIVTRPTFAVLFARIRDRVATLRALYGAGPLTVDFSGLGDRSRLVELETAEWQFVHRPRRSSRTGEVFSIGGFTGHAIYSGPIGEFHPWLEAAQWTGVGRHTVWGKGQIRVAPLPIKTPPVSEETGGL